MDINLELERVKAEQMKLVNEINAISDQINQLNQIRQDKLREADRLSGEFRAYNKMKEQGNGI